MSLIARSGSDAFGLQTLVSRRVRLPNVAARRHVRGDLFAARERALIPGGADARVFKADGAETDDRYCVSEWWLESCDSGPGPHSHQDNVEIFYVIEGTMSLPPRQRMAGCSPRFVRTYPSGGYARLREPERESCRGAQRVPAGRFRSEDAGDCRLVRRAKRLGHPPEVATPSLLSTGQVRLVPRFARTSSVFIARPDPGRQAIRRAENPAAMISSGQARTRAGRRP